MKPTRVELGLEPIPGTFEALEAELARELAPKLEAFKRQLSKALGPLGRVLARCLVGEP
jgi:hypothetical protein